MRSAGNAPTAEQKRWHSAVASLGCLVCGSSPQLHHAVGATCEVRASDKITRLPIGHWWVIPLCDEHHRGLHAGEAYDHDSRKDYEKWAFRHIVARLWADLGLKAFPTTEIIEAIQDYHK